ncbi:MAG: hypothetical protein KA712_22620 [Myxococcales bacterium]|nr:hypothetical protein [Myxococcales bacterium]
MTSGRGKQGQQQRAGRPRSNSTPADSDFQDAFEARLDESGRHGGRPHEGLVGPHEHKREASPDAHAVDRDPEIEESLPASGGSDVGPTATAKRQADERHRREDELGHHAAGRGDRLRAENDEDVSREDLDEARKQADEVVAHGAPGPERTSDEHGAPRR